MIRRSLRATLLACGVGLGVLAGCASTGPEATVQAFSSLAGLPAEPTYRFERLPSQAAQPGQLQLEAAADGPLARAGLRRDDASPRYAVQVRSTTESLAVAGPGVGTSVGIGLGSGGFSGVGIGIGIPIGGAPRPSQRVDVVLRELATGRTVFESSASGGGQVSTTALLEAALQGFPTPPPGPRRVTLAAPAR